MQRIHACIHGVLFFNPRPVARFNAPNGEYGTMYVGSDLACCFVETFGRLSTAADTTVRSVSQAQLLAACLSEITPARPLALVDLTGPGLRSLDAAARLFAGDRAQAQLWGRAFWSSRMACYSRPGTTPRCSASPCSTARRHACMPAR